MSDETNTPRTRTPNPYTVFAKAKASADRVRKAAVRAASIREQIVTLTAKAEELEALAATLPEVEAAEQAALTAVEEALRGSKGLDTDTVADEG